jgi:glutaminyl-peptide cyclotransferase
VLRACVILCGAILVASSCDSTVRFIKSFSIDADQDVYLAEFIREPHPFGSKRQREFAELLLQWVPAAYLQEFEVDVPNPKAFEEGSMAELSLKRQGQNVLAPIDLGKSCITVLGSHYDTKELPGIRYLGANDGGSSTILLVYLHAFVLKHIELVKKQASCNLLFVWFDGEESTLMDWYAGERFHPSRIKDNTYGSRNFVAGLTSCAGETQKHCYKDTKIEQMFLVDMIGMPDLKISKEMHSDLALRQKLEKVADKLGYSNYLGKNAHHIEDDHMPFIKAGIKALNLIDFENMYTWHHPSDTQIHFPSIIVAGQLLLGLILM